MSSGTEISFDAITLSLAVSAIIDLIIIDSRTTFESIKSLIVGALRELVSGLNFVRPLIEAPIRDAP